MFHWGCCTVGRCRIGLLALGTAVSRAARGCRDRKKHGTFLRVSIGAGAAISGVRDGVQEKRQ